MIVVCMKTYRWRETLVFQLVIMHVFRLRKILLFVHAAVVFSCLDRFLRMPPAATQALGLRLLFIYYLFDRESLKRILYVALLWTLTVAVQFLFFQFRKINLFTFYILFLLPHSQVFVGLACLMCKN